MSKFNHTETSLDLNDTSIRTVSQDTKKIVVEASDLKAAGIEPYYHVGVISSAFTLFLTSPKLKMGVPFMEQISKRVIHNGDVVANVFVPVFNSIYGKIQMDAFTATKGWELHILND